MHTASETCGGTNYQLMAHTAQAEATNNKNTKQQQQTPTMQPNNTSQTPSSKVIDINDLTKT
jgi:hypothetical protein